MLVTIDGNCNTKEVEHVARQADFKGWRAKLTDAEHTAIMEEIGKHMGGKEVEISSFIPGADWTGTPFQPIYDKACAKDFDASRKFFGLLVWEWMMNDDRTWGFGRYATPKNPNVEGMTYFEIKKKGGGDDGAD